MGEYNFKFLYMVGQLLLDWVTSCVDLRYYILASSTRRKYRLWDTMHIKSLHSQEEILIYIISHEQFLNCYAW